MVTYQGRVVGPRKLAHIARHQVTAVLSISLYAAQLTFHIAFTSSEVDVSRDVLSEHTASYAFLCHSVMEQPEAPDRMNVPPYVQTTIVDPLTLQRECPLWQRCINLILILGVLRYFNFIKVEPSNAKWRGLVTCAAPTRPSFPLDVHLQIWFPSRIHPLEKIVNSHW